MPFNLVDNFTASQWSRELLSKNIPRTGGTNFANVLNYVADQVFTPLTGARPRRFAVPRVLVVITDGQSSPGSTKALIPAARERLVNLSTVVYAVGVGNNVRAAELELISGSPDRVYELADFQQLFDGLTYNITHAACDEPVEVVDDDYDGPGDFDDDGASSGGGESPSVGNGTRRVVFLEVDRGAGPLCVEVSGAAGRARAYVSFDEASPNASNTNRTVDVAAGGASAVFGVHDPAATPVGSDGLVFPGPRATAEQQRWQRRSWAAGRYLSWQGRIGGFRAKEHCVPASPAVKPAPDTARVPLYIALEAESERAFDRVRVRVGPLEGSLTAPDCPAGAALGSGGRGNRSSSVVCSACNLTAPDGWQGPPADAGARAGAGALHAALRLIPLLGIAVTVGAAGMRIGLAVEACCAVQAMRRGGKTGAAGKEEEAEEEEGGGSALSPCAAGIAVARLRLVRPLARAERVVYRAAVEATAEAAAPPLAAALTTLWAAGAVGVAAALLETTAGDGRLPSLLQSSLASGAAAWPGAVALVASMRPTPGLAVAAMLAPALAQAAGQGGGADGSEPHALSAAVSGTHAVCGVLSGLVVVWWARRRAQEAWLDLVKGRRAVAASTDPVVWAQLLAWCAAAGTAAVLCEVVMPRHVWLPMWLECRSRGGGSTAATLASAGQGGGPDAPTPRADTPKEGGGGATTPGAAWGEEEDEAADRAEEDEDGDTTDEDSDDDLEGQRRQPLTLDPPSGPRATPRPDGAAGKAAARRRGPACCGRHPGRTFGGCCSAAASLGPLALTQALWVVTTLLAAACAATPGAPQHGLAPSLLGLAALHTMSPSLMFAFAASLFSARATDLDWLEASFPSPGTATLDRLLAASPPLPGGLTEAGLGPAGPDQRHLFLLVGAAAALRAFALPVTMGTSLFLVLQTATRARRRWFRRAALEASDADGFAPFVLASSLAWPCSFRAPFRTPLHCGLWAGTPHRSAARRGLDLLAPWAAVRARGRVAEAADDVADPDRILRRETGEDEPAEAAARGPGLPTAPPATSSRALRAALARSGPYATAGAPSPASSRRLPRSTRAMPDRRATRRRLVAQAGCTPDVVAGLAGGACSTGLVWWLPLLLAAAAAISASSLQAATGYLLHDVDTPCAVWAARGSPAAGLAPLPVAFRLDAHPPAAPALALGVAAVAVVAGTLPQLLSGAVLAGLSAVALDAWSREAWGELAETRAFGSPAQAGAASTAGGAALVLAGAAALACAARALLAALSASCLLAGSDECRSARARACGGKTAPEEVREWGGGEAGRAGRGARSRRRLTATATAAAAAGAGPPSGTGAGPRRFGFAAQQASSGVRDEAADAGDEDADGDRGSRERFGSTTMRANPLAGLA